MSCTIHGRYLCTVKRISFCIFPRGTLTIFKSQQPKNLAENSKSGWNHTGQRACWSRGGKKALLCQSPGSGGGTAQELQVPCVGLGEAIPELGWFPGSCRKSQPLTHCKAKHVLLYCTPQGSGAFCSNKEKLVCHLQ